MHWSWCKIQDTSSSCLFWCNGNNCTHGKNSLAILTTPLLCAMSREHFLCWSMHYDDRYDDPHAIALCHNGHVPCTGHDVKFKTRHHRVSSGAMGTTVLMEKIVWPSSRHHYCVQCHASIFCVWVCIMMTVMIHSQLKNAIIQTWFFPF